MHFNSFFRSGRKPCRQWPNADFRQHTGGPERPLYLWCDGRPKPQPAGQRQYLFAEQRLCQHLQTGRHSPVAAGHLCGKRFGGRSVNRTHVHGARCRHLHRFVSPWGASTGTMNINLNAEATGTFSGDEATASIALATGQIGRYTFTGAAGDGWGLGTAGITTNPVTTGSVTVTVFKA